MAVVPVRRIPGPASRVREQARRRLPPAGFGGRERARRVTPAPRPGSPSAAPTRVSAALIEGKSTLTLRERRYAPASPPPPVRMGTGGGAAPGGWCGRRWPFDLRSATISSATNVFGLHTRARRRPLRPTTLIDKFDAVAALRCRAGGVRTSSPSRSCRRCGPRTVSRDPPTHPPMALGCAGW